MREILFRGQRKSDKEWIFGNLLKTDDGVFIIQNYAPFEGIGKYEAGPETVCQYVGLTDKNGRKIFGGDIVEVCTFGFNPERFVTEVIYDKCSFRLKNGRNMFYFGQSNFSKMDDGKVIGNIFDNPELIGDQP